MFEQASRLKFRFDSARGQLTVEDLWDLPLTSSVGRPCLDDIARQLNRALKTNQEEDVSFVEPATPKTTILQDKFDIVKHIIAVRLAERNAAADERARAEKKQRILEIIAKKQDASLESASTEELETMLAAL